MFGGARTEEKIKAKQGGQGSQSRAAAEPDFAATLLATANHQTVGSRKPQRASTILNCETYSAKSPNRSKERKSELAHGFSV
jgi:hypothetical protein